MAEPLPPASTLVVLTPQDRLKSQMEQLDALNAQMRQTLALFPLCCWRKCGGPATLSLGVWEVRSPGGDYLDRAKLVCDWHAGHEDPQRHRVDLPQAALLRRALQIGLYRPAKTWGR
jgi:hypothetical protein